MARFRTWRSWFVLVALLALSASPSRALADPASDEQLRSNRTDDVAGDDDSLTQQRLEALRRQRDSISRAGPITLLVLGSVVGVVSLELTMLSGLHALSDSPTTSPPPSLTGFYVASGIGFATGVGGLFWLFDCNRRRGEIDERMERLRHQSAFTVVPTIDPKTGTAGLAFAGRF